MNGHKRNFFAVIFGLLIGSFTMLWYDNFKCFYSFKKTVSYQTHTQSTLDSSVYNKTCGLQYWNAKSNFENKDDIRFFFILSSILTPIEGTMNIIEFGANIGQFSEIVFISPHSVPYVVYSLEPVGSLFRCLQNLSVTFRKKADDKHFLFNIAISDRSGRLPIYTHRPDNPGGASTLGKGAQIGFHHMEDVVVSTLPDFIHNHHIKTPISLVKIDVEGFEPEVIFGMNLTANAAMFPVFIFETGGTWRDDRSVLARSYTLKSFIDMLHRFGYDCLFIGNPYLLPISGQNWDDAFDGFSRNPNVLCLLRDSTTWKKLMSPLFHITLSSCQWL